MRWNRDTGAAAAASLVIIVALTFGFLSLGAPSVQRLVQADNRRVANLFNIAQQINGNWNLSNHTLPANLDSLPVASSLKDPVTHAPYEYHVKNANQYELCATFARNSRDDSTGNQDTFWDHPKGNFCYTLDPTQTPPPPTALYQY